MNGMSSVNDARYSQLANGFAYASQVRIYNQ